MLDIVQSVNRVWGLNRVVFASLALLCAGCAQNTASHLPNPVLLPGLAIGNALENASYDARRSSVKSHVTQNFMQLNTEITTSGGPALTKSYDLARVPEADRALLTQMLREDPRLRRDPEALTVSLMVHGP